MKINVIYESHFGNGKKIVDDLTTILKNKKHDIKLWGYPLDSSRHNL